MPSKRSGAFKCTSSLAGKATAVKTVDEQFALIRRGVEQIVPEAELRQKLERSFKNGKPLRIKYGIDPTGIDVHLGHTVPLRKLRVFQELGHQAVLMVGRNLQADAGQESQICLTLPILRGTDGTRRMGKSLGNYIGVGESAYDQFAKTMSIPDDLLGEWFKLLTDRPAEEIARLTNANTTHPRQAKE